MFDPEVLQILGLNLMAGKSPNFSENLGNAGLATMQYQRQREEDKLRREEREFLKQQREMQMAQMKREQQFKDALTQGFRPGIAADPLTPMDDEGNAMPSSKPTMDFSRAMQIDPFAAMQAQAQFQNFNKPPPPIAVPEGTVLLDPTTRQPVFQNPKPKDAFRQLTNAEAAQLGLPPGVGYQINSATGQIKAVGSRAPVTNVSVSNPQETAFNKEHGKNLAETYSNLLKADTAATAKLNNLKRLEDLLSNSGNTGSIKPALTSLQAIGKQLGIDISKETEFAQAARALSSQMALELRNPAGGAGMPGALSDKDREFLVSMTAGIDKLPQANRLIIETQRRLAQREREIARLAREYRRTNNGFDDGFYDLLERYSVSKPLFDDLAPALSTRQSVSGQVTPLGSPPSSRVIDFSALPPGR